VRAAFALVLLETLLARFADDIDITLLAFVSYLQQRIFLLEGKPPEEAGRLTRRVVALAYRMALGEGASEQTHASVDRAVERLVGAVTALEELIAEEEQAVKASGKGAAN
jgi:hypothetical protein